MEAFLTPLRTTSTPHDEPLLTISKPKSPEPPQPITTIAPASISTLDDVVKTLQSKPSAQTLIQVLDLLVPSNIDAQLLDIHTPSPKASQVVKTLLELTVPDFWNIVSKSERAKLASCLRSITGLGGIIARLRFLLKSADPQQGVKGKIEELLDLLQGILAQNGVVHGIWVSGSTETKGKRGLMWKEFVTLIAGGKVLSIAAEGETILGRGGRERWVGNGKLFATWLGGEIARASGKIGVEGDEEEWKGLAMLLGRGFSLGYSDDLVEALTYNHIIPNTLPKLNHLLSHLQYHDKRTHLSSLLHILSRKHLSHSPQYSEGSEDPAEPNNFNTQWWESDAPVISQIAALLNTVIGNDSDQRDLVIDWLISSNGGGVGEPIGIRRALAVVLSMDQGVLKVLLERCMGIFGDGVWIRHTPIMRQEVNVQLLLLLSGYAHRTLPQHLHRLARSSAFLNGVSNRLAASSIRARFLGMVVGEALSGLTDKDGKAMDFGVTETASEEARWWKSIVGVEDRISEVNEIIKLVEGGREMVVRKKKQKTEIKPKVQSKVTVIEEIESDGEEEDEFQPYPKPDSDAEDSDEDPTMINRKKETAPVYIRDLLLYLRSTDSYDHQLLALQSAAALIRRKADFGKELTDHAMELASLLTGLGDKFDIGNFQEMRMQALIALVVSSPHLIGGLFASGFFEGDYSLGQRAGMLSAIGMGARELAGYDGTDLPLSVESDKGKSSVEMFPSKKLPGAMHAQWSKRMTGPLDRITGGIEKLMISPMAAEAADRVTGPNILKVRTFSSRIEVEKRRVKPVESRLGRVVAEAFFFPLTGRWWGALKDFGGRGIYFEPFLLTMFLKTLSIILHATGPSAVALPQMTSELWDLLFSLRGHHSPTSTTNDSSVQEAVLLALLTLLEVNTSNDNGRRLAEEHAKELVETQEWVSGILESGQLGEEEKGRILAASVIVKIRGVVDTYQRRIMGEMLSLEA